MLKFTDQEAVGPLMGTVTMKRPDIACAVRAMARCWNPVLAKY